MDKPDVDFIEGLSPAISIDQKSASPQPPVDGRHHHRGLRLPAAALRPHRRAPLPRRAAPWSPARRPSRSSTGSSSCPRAPASRCWRRSCGAARASTRRCSPTWRPQGFARARVDGEVHELTEKVELARYEQHTIEVVVDRLVRRDGHRAAAHRLAGDRAAPGRRRGRGPARARDGRGERPSERDAHVQPAPGLPQLTGSRSRSWRPATSRSTRPTAPASTATASAPASRSTPSWSCPTPTCRSPRARSPRGPAAEPAYFHAWSRRWPTSSALDIDTPLAEAHQAKQQKALLLRHRRRARSRSVQEPLRPRPHLPRHLRGRRSRTCSAATPRPSPTRSREQIEGYMREVPCPSAAAPGSSPSRWRVTVDGQTIAEICEHVDRRRGQGAGRPRAVRARPHDRRAGGQGDQRPHGLPARRRASTTSRCHRSAGTLAGGEAQRIRLAVADRLGPGRRALRARRAVDRAAPARQPPAHRDARPPARPRQHRARRRARRGDDPGRRPRRRHRAGRRRARRRDRALRHGQGPAAQPKARSPASTCRASGRSRCPAMRRPAGRRSGSPCRAPASTTSRTSTSSSRSAASWPSPACRARASRRWSTTSSTGR